MYPKNIKQQYAFDELLQYIFTDELTGLSNRRRFNNTYPEQLKEAKEKNQSFSILIIDIDKFKHFNDTHGHLMGDKILVEVAGVLRAEIGDRGLPVRYAGDEFVVLLPQKGKPEAKFIGNQLVGATAKLAVKLIDRKESVGVTISVGCATYPQDGDEIQTLFRAADKALYITKKTGRNNVCTLQDAKEHIFDKDNLDNFFALSRLVGREKLIKEIKEILIAPSKTDSTMILLDGPLGVGKSRILREIKSFGSDIKFFHIEALCYPEIQSKPLGVILQAIGRAAQDKAFSLRETISKFNSEDWNYLCKFLPLPGKQAVFEKNPNAPSEIPGTKKLENICLEILKNWAENKPLLFIVDELEYCDSATLNIFQEILTSMPPEKFMLSATLTIDKGIEPLSSEAAAFLQHMTEKKLLYRASIPPLTEEEEKEVISGLFPGIEDYPDFLSLLRNRSGGKFFIAEEILKLFIAEGKLYPEKEKWKIENILPQDLPATPDEIIKRRFETLDEDTKNLLQKAAVIGRGFDFEILRKVEGLNDGELQDLIDKARKAHILKEDVPHSVESFTFINKGTRDTIYSSINKDEQKKLHLKVGEAEEEVFKNNPASVLNELYYHFEKAGALDKISKYSTMLEGLYGAVLLSPKARIYIDDKRKAKFWGKETPLEMEDARRALRLARTLKTGAQNIKLFPPHSDIVKEIKGAIHSEITALLEKTEALSLSVADDTLLVNGKVPTLMPMEKNPGLEFIPFLTSTGLKGISFIKDITIDEIGKFMFLLGQKPEEIMNKGGWNKLLKEEKIEKILVNEKIYIALGERDIFLEKELKEGKVSMEAVEGVPPEVAAGADKKVQELIDILKDDKRDIIGELRSLHKDITADGSIKEKLDNLIKVLGNIPQKQVYVESPPAPAGKPLAATSIPPDAAFLDALDEDIPVLFSDLESGDTERVKKSLQLLLSKGEKAVNPLLSFICQNPDLRARKIASEILSHLVDDSNKRLIERAFISLSEDEIHKILTALASPLSPADITRLKNYIVDTRTKVRNAALTLFRELGNETAIEYLKDTLNNENEEIARDVASVLGDISSPDVIPIFSKFIKKRNILLPEKNISIQREVCIALGKIGGKEAVKILIDAINRSPFWSMEKTKPTVVRAAAAWALGNIGDEGSQNSLKKASREGDPNLRGVALLALERLSRNK